MNLESYRMAFTIFLFVMIQKITTTILQKRNKQ
jgi:hypothetical protein